MLILYKTAYVEPAVLSLLSLFILGFVQADPVCLWKPHVESFNWTFVIIDFSFL